MTPINCLIWSCQGLGNPRIVRILNDLLRYYKLDFLFLIETILLYNKIEKLRIKFASAQGFSADRVGRSGALINF